VLLIFIFAVVLESIPYASAPYPLIPLFSCKKLPPPPPSNDVNKLRPGNIKAVMAVGDSISAGFAMRTGHFWDILELLEFRGDVFSAGGNLGSITLPNFLKFYNPDLQGPSMGVSLPLDVYKWQGHLVQPWFPNITHLNAGQSSANIKDVPAQVDYLVDQLQTTYSKTVDFNKDWKLLTIFIGANDVCPSCSRYDGDPVKNGDYYETTLRGIINQIYTKIPRVFVNLMPVLKITQVYDISRTSPYCMFMWDTICSHECGCMTAKDSTPEKRKIMDLTTLEFTKRMYIVAKEWEDKKLTNFTVKIQPFLTNLTIPLDLGTLFLSQLDCFHPSTLANGAFTIGLWNNMLSPPEKKSNTIPVFGLEIMCPDENTYLQ